MGYPRLRAGAGDVRRVMVALCMGLAADFCTVGGCTSRGGMHGERLRAGTVYCTRTHMLTPLLLLLPPPHPQLGSHVRGKRKREEMAGVLRKMAKKAEKAH